MASRTIDGRLDTTGGTFLFRGMPESILEAGREGDRLTANITYRRATPEAALLHWIYFAESPRSDMSSPPGDINLDSLNLRKIERLAKAMRLDAPLRSWLALATNSDELHSTPSQSACVRDTHR